MNFTNFMKFKIFKMFLIYQSFLIQLINQFFNLSIIINFQFCELYEVYEFTYFTNFACFTMYFLLSMFHLYLVNQMDFMIKFFSKSTENIQKYQKCNLSNIQIVKKDSTKENYSDILIFLSLSLKSLFFKKKVFIQT